MSLVFVLNDAGAAGGRGEIRFFKPIPVFACGCLIATMSVD
jgi:hypothetical protein